MQIRPQLPKLLIGGAVAAAALVLASCTSSPGGQRASDVAQGVANLYDRGITGADQARTGETSLSISGEQRRIVPKREQVDSGYYTDGYRSWDEVQDITALLTKADANGSGDATLTEIADVVKTFDTDGDGYLSREENAFYESEYGPRRTEANVGYDRDLNGRGWDAVGDGIEGGIGWLLGE